jgi:predicted nucleotide-binding protein/sugar lactone lactonase YvrE
MIKKSKIINNAVKILDCLIDNGAMAGQDIKLQEVFDSLDLPENEFDSADTYLLQQKYVEGTMGGMAGSRCLTASGVDFYEENKHILALAPNNKEGKYMPDTKKVFVVHGRDSRLRDDFFSFLRALGLQPIEWSEALKLTGKATPYIGEALESAFKNVQAVIVLLSPDDEVRLSPELWKEKEDENEKEIRLQARPNVLFEAGMAFGTHHDRTLLVEVGQVKAFSDVAGRHVVRLSNLPDKRNELAERLRIAGCDVSKSGNDWLQVGDFSIQRVKTDHTYSKAEESEDIVSPSAKSDFRDKLLKPYQIIGAPGVGNGEFQFGGGSDSNAGIFVDYNYLYVTDWNNNRLQRFTLSVDKLWEYFDCVSDSGNLYSTVYVDKDGTMFLQGMGFIRKFDANKNPLGDIEVETSNFCRFVIDREGNILVQSGSDRNMLNKYNSKGKFLFALGGFGNSDGKFNNAGWSADIVSDGAGNIYMLDIGGKRVQKFDNNGNFLKRWQVNIVGYSYMAIDENDRIYVVENGYTLLSQYNTEGALIQQYQIPQGVVSGGAGYIFVNQNLFFASNSFNHNIKVFSFV